ncbi:hypothetical protein BT96DRAFT_942002 [Gymnopus androsaceus JB14]|uniref:Uncharacterized protein n=1 Tax=Gymnopus androsaceus JB14 TaxID=1447944 RepID=A0A6A4HG44_9AGAR|nr:hypothetical protein BT96DRAFT_942002 [Gymnopus androsaceus JB14]
MGKLHNPFKRGKKNRNTGSAAQFEQNPRGSQLNISPIAESTQGSQDQSPVLSPRVSLSHVSTPAEPTQGFQGNHGPSNATQMATGIHVAGATLEKGLKTMKDFADLVPAAPGLGPAIGVLCGCIEVYHQVSKNKQSIKDLEEELVTKIEDLKKYRDDRYQRGSLSTETDKIFEDLTEKLEKIHGKVCPGEKETQIARMLDKLSKVVEAEKISEEIYGYFKDVIMCSVETVHYN